MGIRMMNDRLLMRSNLSGSFRVTRREGTAMFALRSNGLSINHIARILGRSTSTIHNWVKSLGVNHDNRKLPPTSRTNGVIGFYNSFESLTLRISGFLLGLYKTWDDCMDARLVPLNLIDYLVEKKSENSTVIKEEDPD